MATAHRTDGKPRRLARLITFLEHAASVAPARHKADVNALLAVLNAAANEVPSACTVPEWDNHLDDDGEPVGLGDACATYAEWVEDAGVEHDGACQVASVAANLRETLNGLDRLADAN